MAANGSWSQYQKLVLNLLEQHDERLEQLRERLAEGSGANKALTNTVNALKKDIDTLKAIVRDGSAGSPPILTRLNRLEGVIHNMEEDAREKADRLLKLQAYRWTLFVTLLGITATILWNLFERLL